MAKINPTPTASDLLFAGDDFNNSKRLYWDKSHYDSIGAQKQALAKSSTLYIGNLAFSTRTHQIRSHFSQIGPVKTIHLGLDRMKKTPCGFCFVEYRNRCDALVAVANLSGTKLDGKIIRVELDAGFEPGRQYGRGRSGGQVRDEKRLTIDPRRAAGGMRRYNQQQQHSGGKREHGGDEDDSGNTDRAAKRARY